MHPKLPEFADILWGTGVLYQVKLLGSKGLIVFTGKIRCCFFRICAFQYFILFHVITASYLLGSEQKYTAGSVSSEGDSIFYSGISAVKSGSHVLKLYGE